MAITPTRITIPLQGYGPDLDPTTPGIFSYCLGVESTMRGWRLQRAYSAQGGGGALTTLGSTSFVLEGKVTYNTAGTEVRSIAVKNSTDAKYLLYSITEGGSLTNRSGTGYAGGSVTHAVFGQYGNYTYVAMAPHAILYRDSTGSSDFAAASGAGATDIPATAYIALTWGPPTSPRIMLLNYTGASDGWWTSSTGGLLAAWTADIATGAANGRLLGAGALRCGLAYRDDILVFGDRQTWLGRFVGPPAVVEWTKLSDEIGCAGPYAANVLNGVAYWVGLQGLFQYDGQGISKVNVPIQQEIIRSGVNSLAQITVDGDGQRLMVAIRSGGYTSALTMAKWYSINALNGKVGLLLNKLSTAATASIQCALDRKYAALFDVDSLYIAEEETTPFVAALTDLMGFGLPYLGAVKGDTHLTGVYPRFITAPTSFKMTDYYGPTLSEATSTGTAVTVTATPYRADTLQTARWHAPRLHFSVTGTTDWECVDVVLQVATAGSQ